MSTIIESSKFDFSSDVVQIFVFIYDKSGSMEGDVRAMRSANEAFKKDFMKFEDRNSVVVSKAVFDESFYMSPFLDVSEFNTDYYTGGGTALYNAIEKGVDQTIIYYQELVKRLNIHPRITFFVFSDGEDTTYVNPVRAQNAIAKLNSLDATTVYVAFRDAIYNNTGSDLGFTCTRDISNSRELISCLGVELSQSCKEQSRSAVSLKSEFFSKASAESEEDNKEENFFDDDFFNV